MKRITLFHWNIAEGEERAASLRSEGFEVGLQCKVVPAALQEMGAHPPDAVVVDLSRLPSQGRELAGALRRRKATRLVPIVFADGDSARIARVKALLPDASFTDWPSLSKAIEHALGEKPAKPVVPGTMAGYSGTPLPKKLGIGRGSLVALLGAPENFEATLGKLPEGARTKRVARSGADVILLFAKSRAELERRFPKAAKALAEGGRLWIAWPKKASGVATDLTETFVRAHGLGNRFVDYKICAVDETWSGLCFARRR
jgi:CheY-like chemotaxis protein